ncbi:MAG TPA: sporangiospore maturation cell wall hydrolase GsmA [Stackebrandtia sp.]|jgi:flagellar protein FlgJ|uniref:sporangiospore maturation cell wall hydrolase GsmA n=1 Tax=Stackebrandtia sp. TaxID=2023065 RepID=UPI002D37545D|nr:sporangiospore maturation cell wall hydrolase GsmA [Stackebrandtia sp.]HZE39041.1 sporangiospore maturation cell wall hydrolase GsmA [Stackebrandtia sp.]
MRKAVFTILVSAVFASAVALAVPGLVMANSGASLREPTEDELIAAAHDAFIDHAGSAAQPSQEEFGVPASVTVAQAILESGWGGSKLATGSNNYFGMKCKNGEHGPIASDCVKAATKECDKTKCWDTKAWFRVYDSEADSFRDHGSYLKANPRYANAFKYSDDADRFIREVHKAGYATDPKYTDKIVTLMQDYNLYRFNG